MSCISIQKKPPFYRELLMVFINNSYEYESYHSNFNPLWCDYFYKDTKYF